MPEPTTDTTTTSVPPKVARGASKKSAPKAKAPKSAEAFKSTINYGRCQPDDLITCLVDNPKKGDSRKRFEVYGARVPR